MERLSVVLRDFPSPRNTRGPISKPPLGSPALLQLGPEGRGYLENLHTSMSRMLGVLSRI